MTKQKLQKGFTLLELLVVLAIIGILAGVIMLAVGSARVKARDAKRAGDIRQMVTALEQYYIQNAAYPTGSTSLGAGTVLTDSGAMDGGAEPFVPNYTGIIPEAPTPADGSCGSDAAAGNNNYWYEVADDGLRYTLTFCLGGRTGDWDEGTRYATPDGVQ